MITDEERYPKKQAKIFGSRMSYVEEGSGDPIVFLHGNPTSSYLWRNIIPFALDFGRCIAPDLAGMGDSEKLANSGPDSYTFSEHRRYLDALLAYLEVKENVTFVVHDWGSALGFDWSNRHRDQVKGLVYMEALVCPLEWDDWPEVARNVFRGFRSPGGESMILEKNIFVERLLPHSVIRELTEAEMAVYRRPYLQTGESRRPTLTWPRQIPIANEPEDVAVVVTDYGQWLSSSLLPKLFVNAHPGMILLGRQREFCRLWPNQEEVTVKGLHFIQEDSPVEIGTALAAFLKKIRT